MQSVCERNLIRLKTFSFIKEEGWNVGNRERNSSVVICAYQVFCGFFIYLWFCEFSKYELYDGKVANILNLEHSQKLVL